MSCIDKSLQHNYPFKWLFKDIKIYKCYYSVKENNLFIVFYYGIIWHSQLKWHGSIIPHLKVCGRSIARRGCIKHITMISKWGIVCMFYNRHKLNAVITALYDSREYEVLEIGIGRDFRIFSRHSNMTFINAQSSSIENLRRLTKGNFEDVIVYRKVPEYANIRISAYKLTIQGVLSTERVGDSIMNVRWNTEEFLDLPFLGFV